jgi:hypothetical protein
MPTMSTTHTLVKQRAAGKNLKFVRQEVILMRHRVLMFCAKYAPITLTNAATLISELSDGSDALTLR